MADRKVHVDVTLSLIMRVDEGVPIRQAIDSLNLNFNPRNKRLFDLEDSSIVNTDITDSK